MHLSAHVLIWGRSLRSSRRRFASERAITNGRRQAAASVDSAPVMTLYDSSGGLPQCSEGPAEYVMQARATLAYARLGLYTSPRMAYAFAVCASLRLCGVSEVDNANSPARVGTFLKTCPYGCVYN